MNMPVRSLSSSVFRWPDAQTVVESLRQWAAQVARERPEVARIGYFGSYARGDWGVGSDLDLVIVVDETDRAFLMRAVGWDTSALPVPADVLIYTKAEWDSMGDRRPQGVLWVYRRSQHKETR